MSHLVQLRELLARRFPHSRLYAGRPSGERVLPTEVPSLDIALGGGLPGGQITEVLAPESGSGSGQLLHALLHRAAEAGRFLVLIDGSDTFDAAAVPISVLARLLWVRCRTADEALQATDLILRDQNFPVVILDLKMNPAPELQGIPSTYWHRCGRLLEGHGTALLAFTPFPVVRGAACRLQLPRQLGLASVIPSAVRFADGLQFEVLKSPEMERAEAG